MLSRFKFSNKSMQFLCLYFYQKTFLQVLQVLSKSRFAPTILEKNRRSLKASFGDSYCSPLPIIQMECVIMVPDLRYNVKITANIKLLMEGNAITLHDSNGKLANSQMSTFSSKFFDREGEYLLHKFQMINQK